ncbi:2TM domain-containing protein [Hyunsoonleella sp. SJ7]|uniref:2TM domain-containing protein n=1 Tax=Hyunsoonleella aquatilis TaxID=2762758 RepID=A0A923HCK8_9FLAO|nr:2TM domain-containing protein [Hyunsoonleella aquatilis]MBC3759417.1 2TM domain-containing protein [Hyunsoonleella aquatilis]
MKTDSDKNQSYLKAKEKVRQVKIFYYHLVGYFIVVALLIWNLMIVAGPYANFFNWFNSIIMVAWTAFIILHGRWALKGKTFFSKKWENDRAKEFLKKEQNETRMWE